MMLGSGIIAFGITVLQRDCCETTRSNLPIDSEAELPYYLGSKVPLDTIQADTSDD